jgi:hypothetical protein
MFVGSVAHNIDERIEQRIFYCQIMIDNAKVAREEKVYKAIPTIALFYTKTEMTSCSNKSSTITTVQKAKYAKTLP